MKSGIYQILNKNNGKSYVGSAINIEKRWKKHRLYLRENKNSPMLQAAWNKYGEESFQFNVLELVPNKEWLLEIEQYWIDFLETANKDFGYNICPVAGSCLGIKRSEENKRKLSEYNKGNQNALGYKHTNKSKKEMSERNKGKKLSDVTKMKLSELGKGRKHSEATKKKISLAQKTIKFNKTPL